jgi:hypothetical protein
MSETSQQPPRTRRAGRKQADVLIELAAAAELWHAPDGAAYADIEHRGHRETWPVRSRGFRRWLLSRYHADMRGAPSAQAMADALGVLEARANCDGPERKVHVRVADHEGRIYLDLANASWRAIEIDANGWRIIDRLPVRFRRAAGMLPLPEPDRAGSLDVLRTLLNVPASDYVLVLSWLLAALRERGPYPVLGLTGEAGTAKTTTAELLRGLIDPSITPTRSPPREDRDLAIAASNAHILAIDNLSYIPTWLSDAFCRLATGGGYATRQLYSDTDEVLLALQRPVILTSIEDVVTRGDLADRAISIMLAPIEENCRRSDAELRAAYDAARPSILGALLNAVVHGLKRLPHVRLDRLPRMADFALWATACETALWRTGTFDTAYRNNRTTAIDTVIEADGIAFAVRALMADRTEWTGTTAELLAALAGIAGERAARAREWPATPRALAGRLRRVAPALRHSGIHIAHAPRRGRMRPQRRRTGDR